MEELIKAGSLSREVSAFLEKMVVAGYNILVSGGTGCGKTTFLNALSEFIPVEQRVITIEDSAELKFDKLPNLVRLETRNAGLSEGHEISMRDLIRTSLRMRPDRLIIGEVRGKEAVDMLQSMNVGHNAMSTIHANSVQDVVSRLETMVLMGMELPLSAIRRQIVSGFDLLIHLGRTRDGKRKVLEIAEPLEIRNEEVRLHCLYRFEETVSDGKCLFTDETAADEGCLCTDEADAQRDRSKKRNEVPVVGKLVKKGELQHVEKLKAAGIRI